MTFVIFSENLAYKKTTTSNSGYASFPHHNAVDMHFVDLFASQDGPYCWLRIDLDESHFVHELLILARHVCCTFGSLLDGFEIRIGMLLLCVVQRNATQKEFIKVFSEAVVQHYYRYLILGPMCFSLVGMFGGPGEFYLHS